MLRAVCKNNTSELQDLVQLRDEHNIHVSLLNKEINLEGNKNHSFCGYNDAYIYILVYIIFLTDTFVSNSYFTVILDD